MEFYMLKVLLRHGKHIAAVGQEDITAFDVFSHVLVFAFFEVFQFSRMLRLYPAGFMQMHGFPTAFGIILVLQTILDDLELQLSHGAHDFATVELIDKQLRHTLIHQLI